MYGTIYFKDISELADFLRYLTGCTAKFEAQQRGNGWELTFTGGF